MLKSVAILSTHSFIRLEGELTKVASLQCTDFKADYLENKVLCPHCVFPKDFPDLKLDAKIEELERTISTIRKDWEKEILQELKNYKDNIAYLTKEDQKIIGQIIDKNTIPEHISEDVVKTLNNLCKSMMLK